MKHILKLTIILIAGTGLLTLNSCKEEPKDPDPTPAEKICYLSNSVNVYGSDTNNTKYTYNSSNQLISLFEGDEETVFGYTDNKLSTMTFKDDEDFIGTFSYSGGQFPSRLEFIEDGDTSFFIFKTTNNQITTLEYHLYEEGVDILEQVTTMTYGSDGNIIESMTQEYDFDTETLVKTSTITNISTDNKKNPYISNTTLKVLSFFYNSEADLGVNNATAYTYTSFYDGDSRKTEISRVYQYNDEDYPTELTESGRSTEDKYSFSYNCK